ncbi:acyl-CoA--6-aminopenicillanic acid acyltransferase [Rhodovarius crocodyli]|uniref:Acyl-CoA--6-aminopenicillanic acid acyltransferase n=1 Tax=Rhodovarius crocodyli TaxID=1979269 RepID=A0A437MMM3_9PROT|nr:C45 family peptidase [Rhodovarius crocodyli]RVT98908.1 acyl-CoA--6-aminopenicillanic acid acyltransferase [Rhodovarius crocodyli]
MTSAAAEPFPLLELSGAPEARGRLYGRMAKDRVHKSLGHYGAQLKGNGLTPEGVRGMARAFIPRIEAFDADYVAEMRGIAAGADVDLADIVLVNCRTEVLQLAKRAAQPADPDGCTGAIIMPEASADGELIHGQNWDWKSECAETGVVLRIRREDGPDILTFVEAGGLARCGLNGAGVAVTANYLESDRDYKQEGIPLSLLRRKILEQEQVALAFRAIYCTPKSASNNLMLSQASGFGIDVECAPDESFPLEPERGLLVHSNHWLSPVALGKLKDMGLMGTPDSIYRAARVRAALEAKIGKLTIDDMREAFFDDWQSPWSVCRPPRMNLGGNLSATVAMILMKPGQGLMEIAPLPALNREFTRYELNPGALKAAAE